MKSYNGAISVDTKQTPCGTVLEAAKLDGYLTGMVVTSRITHATPACFAAHVIDRNMENKIALHEIGQYPLGRMADLLFGGGYCHFLPNTTAGSCRADDINVEQIAVENGWSFHYGIGHQKRTKLPLINLFAMDHMSYEIDRNPNEQPSLADMVKKALDILSKESKSSKGFFLMIEGSRIDMAAHANDPAAHVHEILAYNEAVQYVKEFVSQRDDTVMISVSDHETGGVALGRQLNATYPDYVWYPHVVERVKKSTAAIGEYLVANGLNLNLTFIKETVFGEWLGISDVTDKEASKYLNLTAPEYEYNLGRPVSERALIGWSTHGHSGVDVNLYAHGVDADKLRGNHENTDIGEFIVNFLELDLMKVTKRLLGMDVGKGESDTPVPNTSHYHSEPPASL